MNRLNPRQPDSPVSGGAAARADPTPRGAAATHSAVARAPGPADSRVRQALRGVALFEAVKGLLAVAAMLGALTLLHRDLHRLALELIGHFGLNPHDHYPAALIEAADRVHATPSRTLWWWGCGYASLRWGEAWGLWHDRSWGQWLGVLSGGLYLPFEVRHLLHHPTWQSALVLGLNLLLVAGLLARLVQTRARAARGHPPG